MDKENLKKMLAWAEDYVGPTPDMLKLIEKLRRQIEQIEKDERDSL